MKRELYMLKVDLDVLRSKTGRSTELISLFIHKGKQIHEVMGKLREEYNQASNIKSRLTRQNVLSALNSLMSRLKFYKDIPENGLIIFCGYVDAGGNKTDLETYVIVPPEAMTFYKYSCDSKFLIEPLEEMLCDKKLFGLIVMDRNEATIGVLSGKSIRTLDNFESNIMGKHNKGGQSAHRFQELHRIAIEGFYKKIGERSNNLLLPLNPSGIIIGSPSFTKEEFMKGGYLDYRLQGKMLGMYDIGYTDEYGLRELVDKSMELLQDLEIIREKKFTMRFMRELGQNTGLAMYGKDMITCELDKGRVETLLISENYDKATAAQLMDAANHIGSEVVFISGEFEEGRQLLLTFGGVAAILRY